MAHPSSCGRHLQTNQSNIILGCAETGNKNKHPKTVEVKPELLTTLKAFEMPAGKPNKTGGDEADEDEAE